MAKILIFVAIWALLIISWGSNVFKLVKSDFEAPYKTELIRGVGVPFVPLGIIIGFMDIGEENN